MPACTSARLHAGSRVGIVGAADGRSHERPCNDRHQPAKTGVCAYAAPSIKDWRPEPELNRRARFCRALPHHSGIWSIWLPLRDYAIPL